MFLLVTAVVPASAESTVHTDGKRYFTYKVEKGDTIYSLARENGITVEELRAANDDLSDILSVGQKLRIPKTERVAEERRERRANVEKAENKAERSEEVVVASTAESVAEERKMATMVEKATRILEQLITENKLPASANNPVPVQVKLRTLKRGERANVVLMLPLGAEDRPAKNYIDFYRGFLMGVDSVRLSGHSVNLDVYNTARDSVRIAEIIASGALDKADLVVGPVYEEDMKPVLAALEGKGVPVVSPLATLTDTKSNSLFQMAPTPDTRMTKLRELFNGDRRVIIISTQNVDEKFDKAIRAMLPDSSKVVEKHYLTEQPHQVGRNVNELVALIRGNDQPVVVVTSNNEVEVDRLLNALHTVRQSLTRYNGAQPFILLGSHSWTRFASLEKISLYKSGVTMVSNYFSHTINPTIRTFEKRFIRSYGLIPSLFAFRGYDAATLFIRALYNDKLSEGLVGESFVPLCTPYRFKKDSETGIYVNQEWVKQSYNKDYTVTFE